MAPKFDIGQIGYDKNPNRKNENAVKLASLRKKHLKTCACGCGRDFIAINTRKYYCSSCYKKSWRIRKLSNQIKPKGKKS